MSTLLVIQAGDRLRAVSESERERNLKAVSLLDEPVRRRLFDWVLAQGRPVGREEASRTLRISRPLATFHLDKLADAGLLESGYQRLSGRTGPGAGRPARVYWRSEREFNVQVPERNYERAAELFATALEHTGGLPTPLRVAAGELGENLGAQERARSSTRRLMDALEDGGYEPQVDESGAIRLLNCPFHALVEEHRPLVCGTNLALAEGITRGARVTDMVPVLDSQPGYCCVSFHPTKAG
jgi:predicted ArsR family transcriptional regulator